MNPSYAALKKARSHDCGGHAEDVIVGIDTRSGSQGWASFKRFGLTRGPKSSDAIHRRAGRADRA
jgi:hypothetical protein